MTLCFKPNDLKEWSGGEWVGGMPASVNAVVHDTRQVRPGALFVAIRGAHFDGHDFVAQAVQSGAVAAMVAPSHVAALAPLGIPLLVVDDPALAMRDLATEYRLRLGLTVVGVSGSTGKTTVKEMIACLLKPAMATAWTKGNWNNEIGLPLSILAIPAETKVGVLELGISHPGEMAPLCGIALPDWGVVTNVGPVHLEFFASVEAIAREKGELFKNLPAGGTAVVSRDEAHYEILRALAPCRVVTTSCRAEVDADYRLLRDDPGTGVCVVEDRVDGGVYEFRMPIPGQHNRHNALLAIAVARGMGVSWESIVSSFDRYVAPPMRWERKDVDGVTVINDAYNANPISMKAAITTFREMPAAGRKWMALGDMLELGAGEIREHQAIGRFLADGNWAGLVTVGALGSRIAEGAREGGMDPARIHVCTDTAQALSVLTENIVKGDALLVKASRGKRLENIVAGLIDGLKKD